jgi:alanine dehydrogenase
MTAHNQTPLEQLLDIALGKKALTLGLPATREAADHRFALTPEGAAMLIDRGVEVRMEQGAGRVIHYDDVRYASAGVKIVSRGEAFASDIVLHLSPLSAIDVRRMRRGAMLLSMLNPNTQDPEAVQVLLDRHIISLALDLVKDTHGNPTFADILNEIDGRASISVASSMLADSNYGKAILLGGVAGIIPCEVTIIGADTAGIAAARSALGIGALVRIFDNNVYRLRCASQLLGPGVAASALHPRVLMSALRSADVVIASHIDHPHVIEAEAVAMMKEGVITFNLDNTYSVHFPSLKNIDLSTNVPINYCYDGRKVCFVNAAGAVPRTTAMALSNTLVTMFDDILNCSGGLSTAIKLHPGMQCAAYTFLGRIVNARLAANLGMRHVDINLLLQFS